MDEVSVFLVAGVGVLFIGLSKAGFGGGLGMLTTPLCVWAFSAEGRSPAFTVGLILPLLCAGDAFSLYHYWRKWSARNLVYLLPGVVLGVLLGVNGMGEFSPRQLNQIIGLLAVLFVLFQLAKEYLFQRREIFQPNHLAGAGCGVLAGITSTFAHGAGPVVAFFVIPQRLPKEIYVGTTILIFTWINWIKVPFFLHHRLITSETLRESLTFLPLIPIGVWLGVWLNRKVPEKKFLSLVYLLTLATGVQLLFNFDLARWLK